MSFGPFVLGGGASSGGSEKIIGSGAPTSATVGEVGQDYFDSASGTTYTCIAVSGNTYTWAKSGATKASEITVGEGQEATTLDAALDAVQDAVEAATPKSGSATPTEDTVGAVGQTYTDTSTSPCTVWTCVAVTESGGVKKYTWEATGGAGAGGSTLTLERIYIDTPPTKTAYKAGETFNPAGMVVKADYALDGVTMVTGNVETEYEYPTTALAAGTTSITISLTKGGVTKTATQAVSVTKTSVTVPTLSGSYTYNGNTQTFQFNNEPAGSIATKSGDTSGMNAGSYTTRFTLVDTGLYVWADGSTSAYKDIPVTIGQATPTISASPASLTLNASTLSATSSITTDSDGALTVETSDSSVVTGSISNKVLTARHVNKTSGSATLTVKQAATTNYKAASVQIPVTAAFVPSDVDEASWATISEVSAAGTGDTYWDVGDCKAITLNGKIGDFLTLSNKTVYVFILAFNHNSANGETQGILWGGFKTAKANGTLFALFDSKYSPDASWASYTDGSKTFTMNHKGNSNKGGWKGCDFRYDILGATETQPANYNGTKADNNAGYDATAAARTNPVANTLAAALPSDMRAALKLRTHYVDNVGNSSNVAANVTAVVDLISLMCEFEIFGARSYANQYEQNKQAQFAYFAAGNAHRWFKETATTTGLYVWEASPYCNNAASFCNVRDNGVAGSSGAYVSLALAAAFLT